MDSLKWLTRILWLCIPCIVVLGLILILGYYKVNNPPIRLTDFTPNGKESVNLSPNLWEAPDLNLLPSNAEGDQIRYGRELISHTSQYLGPSGKVMKISNGMNCQNCHLEAGTVPYGNNFGEVATKYPVLRGRSGKVEQIEDRVNDCFQRSLNGEKLDENSDEMQAIVAYLKWVGKDINTKDSLIGLGRKPLRPLDRKADPIKGKTVFIQHCVECHGTKGEGKMLDNNLEWEYPPLYGPDSYNTGAGQFRLSMFAAFVKHNMPFGTTFQYPVLSDEEAWDVAAYVNSMNRPQMGLSGDYGNLAYKPFDYPFGPYLDTFPESQHKYGPFKPIQYSIKTLVE